MANQKFLFVNSTHEEEEFALSISSSAGVADAGKLITLDGAGLLDQSFIPQQDHSGLSNLLVDSHTQYILVAGTRAFTGAQSLGGFKISNLADGTLASDAVNLSQLQASAAGLDLKEAVRLATNAALPAYTAAGSGVGKTLTANANAALSIDGSVVVAGDRLIIKDENAGGAHVDHGIYDVTQVGSGALPFILTRSTDADGTPANEVSTNLFAFVNEGTINGKTGWSVVTTGTITVDTTAIDFTQFQALQSYTGSLGVKLVGSDFQADLLASGGLGLTGNSMNVVVADFIGTGLVDNAGNIDIDFSTLFNEANKPIQAQHINSIINGQGASIVGIEDTAGSFVSGDVEGALSELFTLASGASSPAYTVGAGGVTKGALVKISANNTVLPYDVTVGNTYGIGLAETTQSAAASVQVLPNDNILTGVLSAAVAGARYFWTNAGISLTPPSAAGSLVWQVGVAKNATDLSIEIRYIKKNS